MTAQVLLIIRVLLLKLRPYQLEKGALDKLKVRKILIHDIKLLLLFIYLFFFISISVTLYISWLCVFAISKGAYHGLAVV